MKGILAILLLISLLAPASPHIYSSDSKVTYDFDGNPAIYHIYFSLETGLGANDFVHINWPTKIHSGNTKQALSAKLISFSNNLEVVHKSLDSTMNGADTNYYVSFGVALTPKKWYEIQIFPNMVPAVSFPYHGLIQVRTISSLSSHAIIYDSNMGFSYISIQSPLSSPNSMLVTVSSPTPTEASRVASIYVVDIELTPQNTLSRGGNFTISIHYNSGDSAHLQDTSGLLDFTFMGLCQSITPSSGVAATLNSCEISDDLVNIHFSVNSVTGSQPIKIRTQVSNPLYVSTRGIRAYYIDFISGITQENGYQPAGLVVSPILINDLLDKRLYLLWGISAETTDTTVTNVGLGFYKATGTSVGPFNSFNAGWSFSETSPIEGRYEVHMYLGADGFLEGSVAHNLPAYEGLNVYCSYDTPTKYLICKNVGAFINTDYRYFISGKAYFSTITGTVSNFGDLKILPIVEGVSGVVLYQDKAFGDSIDLLDSNQYLDTSGYHQTGSGGHQIGVAQVVSFKDYNSLNSTAIAMQEFMQGTNSTIGIVPDLGYSQQLLFLLKVSSISGSGAGDSYVTKLLYNNKVIGFETGADERGLDFVAYDSGTSLWSIEAAPCHIDGHVVCEKYNFDPPTHNTQVREDGVDGYNFYGLYTFDCGTAYGGSETCNNGNCATACNMFTGQSTSTEGSSVMAMRKVTFPSTSFHSSLYADDTLLDFLLVFFRGGVATGRILINAYTMVGARLQNIKASYVNYYDSSSNFNKGIRVPTMIRIAGGVLPKESRNATVVGVFFDDNVDAYSFYTEKGEARDIGCSTGHCYYYPNTGIRLFPNDIWHTMRRVDFYDLPPIQSEFNLLVPVAPSLTRVSLPDTLTIAFFIPDHSIGDATNLLRTVSVYRLFGSGVTASIDAGTIGAINGLVTRPNSWNSDFSSPTSSSFSGTFNYGINTVNINSNPPNNTFTYGYSNTITNNGKYGAGVTITSFYYNIFESSTLAFESPPPNTATTCSIFGYVYNQIVSGNADRNGKWIYVAFCPIDGAINLNQPAGNIQFYNPQYPNVFTNSFPLQSVLTYGISQPDGQLIAYRHETNSISAFTRSCSTAKLHSYYPTTNTLQRATFTVSTPQIRMALASTYDGYSTFRMLISFPSISNIQIQSGCIISDPDLTCSTSGGSNSIYVTVDYVGQDVLTVTYFEIQLYAKTTGSLGTGGDYTLSVELPQYLSGTYSVFGTGITYRTSYCTCTSNFKIGNTPLGSSMNFNPPVFLSQMKTTMSTFFFDFGSYSDRDTFFTSSYFQMDFGFLTLPSQTYRNTYSNFRCLVYQNDGGTLTLSDKWKNLDFTSFSSVKLYSKDEIETPNNFLFTMGCYGSGVATSTTDMRLYWMDSGSAMQTATSIPASSVTLTASSISALTASIQAKRFTNQGMKAFYTFSITSSQALNENTRIYFDFNFNLNSRLDNEGYIECYIRPTSSTPDADAIFSYCELTYDRQLVLWNNLNVAAGTAIFVDIFNIQQPMFSNTSPNIITISVDTDDDYQNGVAQTRQLTDSAPSGAAISDFVIKSTSATPDFIRSPQTITIDFDTNDAAMIASSKFLYILFPGPYGEWVNRGQVIDASAGDCYLEATGSGTNVLSLCTYISKRILKMSIASSTGVEDHTLVLKNVYSPSKLPDGRYNQYRFQLFTSATELTMTAFSFTDYSQSLSLRLDDTLIDLSWKYYSLTVSDSLLTLTDISDSTYMVYMGYYSNVIELRQSEYPSNFITDIQLTLNTFLDTDFIHKDGSLVHLGAQNAYIKMAASGLLDAGLYTLQYDKSGDDLNKYTEVPPLTIVVSNRKCALKTEEASYSMPKGGMTLPIKISAISCIPTQNITITPTFSLPAEVSLQADLSSNVLTYDSLDAQLYLVIKDNNAGGLSIASVVTVSFTITGPNAAFYDTIPSITISVVDPVTYQTLPVAKSLPAPVLSYNKATFTLQCSMPSRIYWGLGIYPSILNTQALDFEARIISDGMGLRTNFTEPEDYYKEVYGMNYVATTQTIQKTVYQLKSNAQYIFKYYCMNQMGIISDSQSLTFNSLNYGAYLMKVSITFGGSINYDQYKALSCSLAENFQIPYQRVMTEAMSTCENSSTIFYPLGTSTISKEANSNGEYAYNFYILPDYSIPIDTTNSDIRSALSLSSTSTTIITSTADSTDLPQLIQIQTEDIQFFSTPLMSLSNPLSGLNSVVFTGVITNMNGFIIMGCMDGLYDNLTMTLPTAANIKKGILADQVPLLQVKMLYAIQNYNVTVEFQGLLDNTKYSFFYYATTEDPAITAQSTAVKVVDAQTLQALLVDINWSHSLQLSLAGLVLLLLLLA